MLRGLPSRDRMRRREQLATGVVLDGRAKIEDDVYDEVQVDQHVHDGEADTRAAEERQLQRQHHADVQHKDDRDQVPV